MSQGVQVRHARSCKVKPNGSGCSCSPGFRAVVFDKATGERSSRTFTSEGAARTWRRDAYLALGKGDRRHVAAKLTLQAAAERWDAEARAGVVTTRSGDRYKPAALRSYRQSLRLRVFPVLGERQYDTLHRLDLQALVDRLAVDQCAPATIQGAVTALRVIYRRGLQLGELDVLPTQGLKLPAVRGRRERFATPEEAGQLVAAAPADLRAIWGTAFYTGMRRGELMALKWTAIDLTAGTIDVLGSWDLEHGLQETKNRTRRRVPIPTALREHLAAQRLQQQPGATYALGAGERPFSPSNLQDRSDDAWKTAKLKRITLHEARHTYASLMIAAGVNAKALCDYLGHSSIQVTYDRYGHLMPGNENEAAGLLDAYLAAADEAV